MPGVGGRVVTTAKSEGFRTKSFGNQPPLKYWAMLVAIRRVLQTAPYPEVMDSLFEPTRDDRVADNGKRIYG